MRGTLLMCALWLGLAALAQAGTPAVLAVGQTMPSYTLKDQFDTYHTLAAPTHAVVLSFEMEVSKMINAYLAGKGKDVFTEQHIDYISDIAPMPALISKMFAVPKMKKYGHIVLLNRDDAFHTQFPVAKGKALIVLLDGDLKVTAIEQAATAAELAKALGLDAP